MAFSSVVTGGGAAAAFSLALAALAACFVAASLWDAVGVAGLLGDGSLGGQWVGVRAGYLRGALGLGHGFAWGLVALSHNTAGGDRCGGCTLTDVVARGCGLLRTCRERVARGLSVTDLLFLDLLGLGGHCLGGRCLVVDVAADGVVRDRRDRSRYRRLGRSFGGGAAYARSAASAAPPSSSSWEQERNRP